jgi:hypothetical protein
MKFKLFRKWNKYIINNKYLRDRAYLDIWSIGHILVGFLCAWLFLNIGFSTLNSALLVFGIATFWELIGPPTYEKIMAMKFPEKLPNKLIDIALDMVGWYIALITLF